MGAPPKNIIKCLNLLTKLLLSFDGSLATKCISLNNLNSNKLNYPPFIDSFDRCNGSCNTLDDLSSIECVLNKTEDENLNVFNTIKIINELKTLIKHISCDCNANLMVRDVIQNKTAITINGDTNVKNQ